MLSFFVLGANDRREEGVFQWSDGTRGSRYSFRWFGRGQPDDRSPGQDCVMMHFYGRRRFTWSDHYCQDELPFICKVCPINFFIYFLCDSDSDQ